MSGRSYLSVCSGGEAATVAWHPLGWKPWAYSEIEPFPCYVLNHHYGSGRPHHMPDPGEPGLTVEDRKERRANIKAVSGLQLSPFGGNGVPNLGDMSKFKEWPDAVFNVLVGGTPCQSYSVAGLGAGLDDPRGDLMLTYVAIARRYRPAWVVWENVPGVLSNDEGRAFGTLLGLLTGKRVEVPAGGWETAGALEGYKSAYGVAWRILDSQFVRVDGFGRAVPQRRRRVFVVGYLGDWRRAAAVLFERAGLSGDSAPRREAGKNTAGAITASSTRRGGVSEGERGGLIDVAGTIEAAAGKSRGGGTSPAGLVPQYVPDIVPQAMSAKWSKGSSGPAGDEVANLVAFGEPSAFSFKASHFTRDKDGAPSDVFPPLSADADKGDQDPLVCAPIAFDSKASGRSGFGVGQVSPTLRAMNDGNGHANGGGQVAIAFDTTQITNPDNRSNPQPDGPSHPLSSQAHPPAIVFQPRYARNGRGAPDTVASALTSEAGETGKGDSAQCVAIQERAVCENPNAGPDGVGVRDDGAAYTLEARAVPQAVATAWAVRRLTPTECERLQAMPDGYTDVPWRGAPGAPDGPRYKLLGNGMSANVMRWIGMRIDMVDAIAK